MSYHVNPETGSASQCAARKGRCPFGSPEAHYSSAQEAREAYEASMEEQTVPLLLKEQDKSLKRKETPMAKKLNLDDTRDEIAEKSASLTEKSARRIFEKPYAEGVLSTVDEDTREFIFTQALEASDPQRSGKWGETFNEYADILRTVEAVRTSSYVAVDKDLGAEASEILNAKNRLSMLFHKLRKAGDLSEERGQEYLEAAYPLAVTSLDTEARKAIFQHAYSRESASGWLAVAQEYGSIIDVVSRVKLSPAERQAATDS